MCDYARTEFPIDEHGRSCPLLSRFDKLRQCRECARVSDCVILRSFRRCAAPSWLSRPGVISRLHPSLSTSKLQYAWIPDRRNSASALQYFEEREAKARGMRSSRCGQAGGPWSGSPCGGFIGIVICPVGRCAWPALRPGRGHRHRRTGIALSGVGRCFGVRIDFGPRSESDLDRDICIH